MSVVLVIDDDALMLKAIRNILKKDGHEVITACDGREAFEKLDNEEYDAVVTDMMMPFANGLDVVARLRSKSNKHHVGVMVCSSIGNEETITEAYNRGADDYMKKPISAGDLMMRVRNLLTGRKDGVATKKK